MAKPKPSDEASDAKGARARQLASAWSAWPGRLASSDSHTTELMWFAFQAGFEAGARRGQEP